MAMLTKMGKLGQKRMGVMPLDMLQKKTTVVRILGKVPAVNFRFSRFVPGFALK